MMKLGFLLIAVLQGFVLRNKYKGYGVTVGILNFIQFFLSHHEMNVISSRSYFIITSVIQSSVFLITLLLISIIDLPNFISSQHSSYTDDIIIYPCFIGR